MSDVTFACIGSAIVERLKSLVPGFKYHSQFVLYLPVSILRVIINVRCSLIKRSEWFCGKTPLSCSRGPGFKSQSQFHSFISICVYSKSKFNIIKNIYISQQPQELNSQFLHHCTDR